MADFAWLDEYINKHMLAWHVPGVSVGILQNGEVSLLKGYGYRDVENKLPVTPQTLFGVASTSKAFTAMTIGMLVDEGKLAWDTPIREYMPEFDLWDKFTAERITPLDLLCHRSGLPRHDAMWYQSPLSREELVKQLKYLEPSADFRTKWQYQNMMYVTAGYLVERVTGQTWEKFVQKRIFAPLGMTESNISPAETQKTADHALPYENKDSDVHRIPFIKNFENTAPAGAINANAEEMLRWLKLHLEGGKIGEQRLISEDALRTMHTPQMIIDDPERNELFGEPFINYGLGWIVQSYRGHRLFYHGGAIDGFTTRASFMPESNTAVFVTCNLDGSPLPSILMLSIYDRVLNLEARDWSGKTRKLEDKAKAESKQTLDEAAKNRVADTQPSHPLEAFIGEYIHPAYHILKVEKSDDSLQCVYNSRTWRMEHYHYDIFDSILEDVDETHLKMSFATGTNGKIESVSIPLQEGVKPIMFERINTGNST